MPRCETITKNGQCKRPALPDCKNCAEHGGTMQARKIERQHIFNYNLTKFKARVQNLTVSPALKSLSEEIGVVRMVLETLLNRCEDEHALMLASTQISSLVMSIERLVLSANKLDINLGQLLDRNKATQLADEIIQIITEEIQDEETISKVAMRISAAMNHITVAE